jgi:hypothetical protein
MLVIADWTFLTDHARVLLCIAHDPGGVFACPRTAGAGPMGGRDVAKLRAR